MKRRFLDLLETGSSGLIFKPKFQLLVSLGLFSCWHRSLVGGSESSWTSAKHKLCLPEKSFATVMNFGFSAEVAYWSIQAPPLTAGRRPQVTFQEKTRKDRCFRCSNAAIIFWFRLLEGPVMNIAGSPWRFKEIKAQLNKNANFWLLQYLVPPETSRWMV